MLSDFRYSGGTSASIAEEIQAQARAGYRTGLVHVPAAHLRTARTFNSRIRDCIRAGFADLLSADETVHGRALVIRQPRVFATPPIRPLHVTGDAVVCILNQGPCDAQGEEHYYDLATVAERVHTLFGEAVEFIPIGPLVRDSVLSVDPTFPLKDWDWHNIIDVQRWEASRAGFVTDRPVIGRHSRGDWKKWPATPGELLAAYPADESFRVRILGGADTPQRILGYLPENWEVFDYNALDARRFLRSIDFFVYFHHPLWIEAFGRAILEAIASGAPAVLPGHFKRVFGDAALYCSPDEVQALVRRLYNDPSAYREQSRRGQERAAQRFSYATHAQRLRDLIGSPTQLAASPRLSHNGGVRGDRHASDGALSKGGSGPTWHAGRERMLFVSSNGSGLGHLTRLMAVSRRLPERYQAIVATQSQAVELVRQEGILTEYIPSNRYLASDSRRWNAYLWARLEELIAAHDPSLVLVDGTVPYGGLVSTMESHPRIPFVWMRRAMWRRGQGHEWLRRGAGYHTVIEPGEFAAPLDRGPTAGRGDALIVDPIVYLDEDELLPRSEARAALDLEPEGSAVLIQLGAGNINDVTSDVRIIADRLHAEPDTQVALAQSPISVADIEPPPGVRVVRLFPMSRYYRAFDFVVSASGYNSYHELIRFGVPSLFVPNLDTDLDDQAARAKFAEDLGVAKALEYVTPRSAGAALDALVDTAGREAMQKQCELVRPENGAQAAADILVSLVEGDATERGTAPDRARQLARSA